MQTDPTACHSLIGSLAALLPSHGAAPTGLRGRPVRCRSVTMSSLRLPVPDCRPWPKTRSRSRCNSPDWRCDQPWGSHRMEQSIGSDHREGGAFLAPPSGAGRLGCGIGPGASEDVGVAEGRRAVDVGGGRCGGDVGWQLGPPGVDGRAHRAVADVVPDRRAIGPGAGPHKPATRSERCLRATTVVGSAAQVARLLLSRSGSRPLAGMVSARARLAVGTAPPTGCGAARRCGRR